VLEHRHYRFRLAREVADIERHEENRLKPTRIHSGPILYCRHALAFAFKISPCGFQPCQPVPADRPPTGSNWIHEIKHDGYRLMARREGAGIRLLNPQRRRLDRALSADR
jgi:hypothetical protein